jgi:hypothetical protein
MLVLEDIHWADRGLLDLIELLAARLRDLPVLILTLARPELIDARPAWGGGLPAYTALPLSPLSSAEAEQLAQIRLGQLTEAASRLADTAGGNPLFIEQLAATMAESSAAGGTLPTTIRGILAARLDALPAEERALLLDAAVVGKTFWRGALERRRLRAPAQSRTARAPRAGCRVLRGVDRGARRGRGGARAPLARRRGARAGSRVPDPGRRAGRAWLGEGPGSGPLQGGP